jgi:mRNA-degrading endonuclease RelE of RelBE toxin-antitoxin system
MHGSRRVHNGSSFVLIYEVDEKAKMVKMLDFGHHDKVY